MWPGIPLIDSAVVINLSKDVENRNHDFKLQASHTNGYDALNHERLWWRKMASSRRLENLKQIWNSYGRLALDS